VRHGENAILFAKHGRDVWGIDAAPLAIQKAKKKAKERRSTARFIVGDALRLEILGEKFDTITDCGLFHIFSDDERPIFARSLRSGLKVGGSYFMLCFGDKEPASWGGPRRVTRQEITETFRDGWVVNWIREAKIETSFHEHGGCAWLSSVTSRR